MSVAVVAVGLVAATAAAVTGRSWLVAVAAAAVPVAGAVLVGRPARRSPAPSAVPASASGTASGADDDAAARERLRVVAAMAALRSLDDDPDRLGPAGLADPLLDEQTGLLNDRYFRAALEDRVATARRHLRPVTVVMLDAVGPEGGPALDPVQLADLLLTTLRESDSLCRLDATTFGVILEDTPGAAAVGAVERVRQALSRLDGEASLWAGIASYPTHGLLSADVLARSEQALADARASTRDRIQVASAE